LRGKKGVGDTAGAADEAAGKIVREVSGFPVG
jgi:hypothetical protein